MVAEPELAEYLDEVRREVCSQCVERPPGGPPCAPLGKTCGIELHLPELIDAIHQARARRALRMRRGATDRTAAGSRT